MIASDIDGMRDLLEEGYFGFRFPPGERTECREALRKALQTDPSVRQGMGQALQQHIQTHYTHEREAARYQEILAQITYQHST